MPYESSNWKYTISWSLFVVVHHTSFVVLGYIFCKLIWGTVQPYQRPIPKAHVVEILYASYHICFMPFIIHKHVKGTWFSPKSFSTDSSLLSSGLKMYPINQYDLSWLAASQEYVPNPLDLISGNDEEGYEKRKLIAISVQLAVKWFQMYCLTYM